MTESIPQAKSTPLEKFTRGLRRIEEVILGGGILLLAVLTISNVVTRTLLGFSITFAEELSQFIMIWVTFVGLSYGASRGRHIRMSAVSDQIAPPKRRFLLGGMALLTTVCLVILTVAAVDYLSVLSTLGTRSPALGAPLTYVYAVVPVGLSLAAFKFLLTAWRNFTSDRAYLSFNNPDEYDEAPLSAE